MFFTPFFLPFCDHARMNARDLRTHMATSICADVVTYEPEEWTEADRSSRFVTCCARNSPFDR